MGRVFPAPQELGDQSPGPSCRGALVGGLGRAGSLLAFSERGGGGVPAPSAALSSGLEASGHSSLPAEATQHTVQKQRAPPPKSSG